jgi:hypothetical protein
MFEFYYRTLCELVVVFTGMLKSAVRHEDRKLPLSGSIRGFSANHLTTG